MFDSIPMDKVVYIIHTFLGMSFNHICKDTRRISAMVNEKLLLELIRLDCDEFDFFRCLSPRTFQGTKPRYFHQRKGIPMGGNTSNVYADLYMSFCISRVRKELTSLGVKLMRKYTDDLLLYAPISSVERIVHLFKDITSLDFTVELPSEGKLPYLDLMIVNDGDRMSTTW